MNSEMDNPLYLPVGHLLNSRYTIGKVLGVGGFGIVYIAWDSNLDIRVAIKEFLPKEYAARSSNHISLTPYTGSAHADFSLGIEKFLDEAKALARFQDHPGIVTVHESFRANNTAYMVMQYLDGITLKEYLKRQPGEKIAFNVAVKAMTPIMDALREVHKAGFVHRDISPDNIFLTTQNQVKLLDFGSARYAIGEHSKSLTSVLKHGYAPVEQYSVKGKQGPWSDVYAVCATIYRCVTGFVPLDAMERIQEDTIKAPKQLGIDIPLSGERALMKGLALKAVDRFENIQQLQKALATRGRRAPQVGGTDVQADMIRTLQEFESEQQKKHRNAIQPHRSHLTNNLIECAKCGAMNQLNPDDDPNALQCGVCKNLLGLKPVSEHNEIKCASCGYERTERDDHFYSKEECPKCHIIYKKFVDKPTPQETTDEYVIKCPECGTRNQFEPGDDPTDFVCGHCKRDFGCPAIDSSYEKHVNNPVHPLAIYLKGYRYLPLGEKIGVAYCHGCKRDDSMHKLYYCRQKDEYYHGQCLISQGGKRVSTTENTSTTATNNDQNNIDLKAPPIEDEVNKINPMVFFLIVCLMIYFVSCTIYLIGIDTSTKKDPLMTKIEQEASKFNATLPKMVNNRIRYDTINVGPGKKVTSVFTITDSKASDFDNTVFYNDVKQKLIKQECKGDLQDSLKGGVTFVYSYYGSDAMLIAEVPLTPADCGY
ncbi:MAG TPA: serine/threonine-protein kinase [Syntrophales bacterium]|nr:serine/threonine-protein kinase [Syntrophales bacterium]